MMHLDKKSPASPGIVLQILQINTIHEAIKTVGMFSDSDLAGNPKPCEKMSELDFVKLLMLIEDSMGVKIETNYGIDDFESFDEMCNYLHQKVHARRKNEE